MLETELNTVIHYYHYYYYLRTDLTIIFLQNHYSTLSKKKERKKIITLVDNGFRTLAPPLSISFHVEHGKLSNNRLGHLSQIQFLFTSISSKVKWFFPLIHGQLEKNDDIVWCVKIKISSTKTTHLMYKIKENVKIKETVKYHLQFYCKTYF